MSRSPEAETMRWLERVVVGLNLCPFAKRELQADRIRLVVHRGEEAGIEQRLQALATEFHILDHDPEVGTTLLIFEDSLGAFEDYLDFLALAEEFLAAEELEGIYQLASFHPDYQFEGSDADDAAHYTNRSPFPMLHILREADVSKALAGYAEPEKIPERNKQVCRELGIEALSALLQG